MIRALRRVLPRPTSRAPHDIPDWQVDLVLAVVIAIEVAWLIALWHALEWVM